MRVNIYAEEMTDRIEIIGKEIEGRAFTGLRFYLELPATVDGKQYQGAFMHRPGDDDSAAVTFWGKRDLRVVLRKALELLDAHYGGTAEHPASVAPLVDRFLSWRLPESVCSDLCVTRRDYPHPRVGTNLLTADEARQMIEYLLAGLVAEMDELRDQRLRARAAAYRAGFVGGDLAEIIDAIRQRAEAAERQLKDERERCAKVVQAELDKLRGRWSLDSAYLQQAIDSIRSLPDASQGTET